MDRRRLDHGHRQRLLQSPSRARRPPWTSSIDSSARLGLVLVLMLMGTLVICYDIGELGMQHQRNDRVAIVLETRVARPTGLMRKTRKHEGIDNDWNMSLEDWNEDGEETLTTGIQQQEPMEDLSDSLNVLRNSRTRFNVNGDSGDGDFLSGFDSLVLVGFTAGPIGVVQRFLARNLDVVYIQDTELSSSLAKKLLESLKLEGPMKKLGYTLDDVPGPLRSSIQTMVDGLVGALASARAEDPSQIPVLSSRYGIYFLPFFKQASLNLLHRTIPLLAVQDGRNNVFETGMRLEQMVNHLGPSLVDERWIDKLCMTRLRDWNLDTPESISSSFEFIEKIEPIASVPTNKENVRPCMIMEVPLLRAGLMWSVVHRTILTHHHGFYLRVEDVLQEMNDDRALGLVNEIIQIHSSNAMGLRSAVTPVMNKDLHSDFIKGYGNASKSVVIDQMLMEQITLSMEQSVLLAFQYPHALKTYRELHDVFETMKEDSTPVIWSEYLMRFPDTPQHAQVDAGYCVQTRSPKATAEEKKGLTRSFGSCLPSYLVVGAQKAGTDELAVWMNANPFTRRLDGGVELHFFDCIGARSKGWDRPPCERIRKTTMTFDSHAPKLNATEYISKFHNKVVAWRKLREESPYASTWWRKYLTLGHLNYYGFYHRKSLTFEKTPAYMDLAHPMDIVRFMPSTKIVFMLRDPVSRFISSYFQSCSGMYQTFSTCDYNDMERRFDSVVEEFKNMFDPVDDDDDTNTMDYVVKRGLYHGLYSFWINRWRSAFPDSNIVVIFSDHFQTFPQGVMHSFQSIVGLTTKHRRHEYHPRMTASGYWVLGQYSKAQHPSHHEKPPPHLERKIREFYRPWNDRLRALLEQSQIVHKPPLPVPEKYNANFTLPVWL